jgi:hypothetical protein
MRQTSFLAGVVVLTISISIANAQARMYSSAGSNNQAGAVSNGDSQRGRAPQATPRGTSPSTPAGQNNFNRPIFTSIDRDRDRDRDGDRDRDRNFRHRVHILPTPGYVYYSDYPPSDSSDQQQQATEQPAQPEAPAPTIFENRPGYQAPPIRFNPSSTLPAGQMAANQTTESVERTSAADPQPTTILVFRDGHMIEIGNYAIVGDTLYNLAGDYRTHKILLADLDLDKTAKINQERGYEFRLPKQQGKS